MHIQYNDEGVDEFEYNLSCLGVYLLGRELIRARNALVMKVKRLRRVKSAEIGTQGTLIITADFAGLRDDARRAAIGVLDYRILQLIDAAKLPAYDNDHVTSVIS